MRTIRGEALAIAVAANLFAACVATSQDNPPPKETPVETPRTEKKTKTIFDFKAELGLTETQEQQIRECLAELVKSTRLNQAKLVVVSSEVDDLVNAEGDLKEIRAKLLESFNLQAEMRYNDIAASRKINGVLTPEQLAKWREIQKKAKKEAPNK